MPRIIVTTDSASSALSDRPVLLSESVHSVHLSTDHAAGQLIERLAWAVRDAESAESAHRASDERTATATTSTRRRSGRARTARALHNSAAGA